MLFKKIDKRDTGKITIDEVFEWFKKIIGETSRKKVGISERPEVMT